MQKFYLFCLCAALCTACGRATKNDPGAKVPASELDTTRYRADCIIPGETEAQCLAYHLVPVSP